jgi:hypothetical protein
MTLPTGGNDTGLLEDKYTTSERLQVAQRKRVGIQVVAGETLGWAQCRDNKYAVTDQDGTKQTN